MTYRVEVSCWWEFPGLQPGERPASLDFGLAYPTLDAARRAVRVLRRAPGIQFKQNRYVIVRSDGRRIDCE